MSFEKEVQNLFSHLESRFLALESLGVDVDEHPDFLKIIMPNKKIYLFSINPSLEQVWLSSPVSGGWHFVYTKPFWYDTRQNQELVQMLAQELQDHFSLSF